MNARWTLAYSHLVSEVKETMPYGGKKLIRNVYFRTFVKASYKLLAALKKQ